jgi:hypothetical protein
MHLWPFTRPMNETKKPIEYTQYYNTATRHATRFGPLVTNCVTLKFHQWWYNEWQIFTDLWMFQMCCSICLVCFTSRDAWFLSGSLHSNTPNVCERNSGRRGSVFIKNTSEKQTPDCSYKFIALQQFVLYHPVPYTYYILAKTTDKQNPVPGTDRLVPTPLLANRDRDHPASGYRAHFLWGSREVKLITSLHLRPRKEV